MRGTGGSLGGAVRGEAGWLPACGPGGPRLMKKTTGDLWRESRLTANGIEPTSAPGHTQRGIAHSLSTTSSVKGVEVVKWVTDPLTDWSTNPEIHE
ncbi:hypothetical protein GCM10010384_12240 [Streptomyces djakartensis]|uniref:Uncharacterized protein n=1 Tax=Streptomyces djakartensis TaxID=68193 RepID=A0ABQ2ZB68_9ACTN|nr:hypothetical protein GCM10010384_12240 [Streptomyces djakartensis]